MLHYDSQYYADFFDKALQSNGKIYENISFTLKKNAGGYDSIVITSSMTTYRPKIDNVLIARINTSSKKPYISFRKKYEKWFLDRGISTYSIKSEYDFFRIMLSDFNCFDNSEHYSDFCKLIVSIYLDSVKFPQFGCCDRFNRCSAEKKCVHDDLLYSTACMYRKNLESGNIFYEKTTSPNSDISKNAI